MGQRQRFTFNFLVSFDEQSMCLFETKAIYVSFRRQHRSSYSSTPRRSGPRARRGSGGRLKSRAVDAPAAAVNSYERNMVNVGPAAKNLPTGRAARSSRDARLRSNRPTSDSRRPPAWRRQFRRGSRILKLLVYVRCGEARSDRLRDPRRPPTRHGSAAPASALHPRRRRDLTSAGGMRRRSGKEDCALGDHRRRYPEDHRGALRGL